MIYITEAHPSDVWQMQSNIKDKVVFASPKTEEERALMQTHAAVGRSVLERAANMVDGVSYLHYGAEIAGAHHEHYDGQGYPNGLKGKDIPLSARIVAVVDVFDSLLHERPYKEPWPYPDVMSYITARRGTQFDPDVVDALLEVIERDPKLGTDEIGKSN